MAAWKPLRERMADKAVLAPSDVLKRTAGTVPTGAVKESKKAPKKSEVVFIRITPAEKIELDRAGARVGITGSEWARRLIRECLKDERRKK